MGKATREHVVWQFELRAVRALNSGRTNVIEEPGDHAEVSLAVNHLRHHCRQ